MFSLEGFFYLEIMTSHVHFSIQTELFILPVFPVCALVSHLVGIAADQCCVACSLQPFCMFLV